VIANAHQYVIYCCSGSLVLSCCCQPLRLQLTWQGATCSCTGHVATRFACTRAGSAVAGR
jgi:hypothetical protein